MGCFNWFFKFLAILLMILVVIFLPITVFANEIGDLLFSTENLITVIDDELINPEFMEIVLSEALVMIQESGDGAEADVMRESIMSLVDEIPADTLNEIVTQPKQINPKTILFSFSINNFIYGFFYFASFSIISLKIFKLS